MAFDPKQLDLSGSAFLGNGPTTAAAEPTKAQEAAKVEEPAPKAEAKKEEPTKAPAPAEAKKEEPTKAKTETPKTDATPKAETTVDAPKIESAAKVETGLVTARPDAGNGHGAALVMAPTGGLPMTLAIEGGVELDISGWVEHDPGMGDLSELNAPVPIVSAGYGQSKIVEEMGLKEGLWTHQATGEQAEELDLVVIDVKMRRDFQAKYDSSKDEQLPVICEAPDGRHGSGSDEFDEKVMPARPFVTLGDDTMHSGAFNIEPGRPCKACPLSEWRDVGGKRKPPLCRETYNVVGDDPTLGPVVVPFRGTGIKPLTRWRTTWWLKVGRMQGEFRRKTGRHLPAALFGATKIRLKKQKTYYVPEFGNIEATPQDRLVMILANHPVYQGVIEMLGSHDVQQAIAEATSFDMED